MNDKNFFTIIELYILKSYTKNSYFLKHKNMQNRSDQGFIAAVLDKESEEKLKKLAIHPNIYCHHMTLAYRPDFEAWERYQDFLDKDITLVTIGMAKDDKGQAVLIEGCPSENTYPHITISCADGVTPKYSNEMFSRQKTEPIDIKLRARVEFIPFDK